MLGDSAAMILDMNYLLKNVPTLQSATDRAQGFPLVVELNKAGSHLIIVQVEY